MPPHAGAAIGPPADQRRGPRSAFRIALWKIVALSIAQLTTVGLLSLFAGEASRVGAKLGRPSTEFALVSLVCLPTHSSP
jgi:hypothetical protein